MKKGEEQKERKKEREGRKKGREGGRKEKKLAMLPFPTTDF